MKNRKEKFFNLLLLLILFGLPFIPLKKYKVLNFIIMLLSSGDLD